MKRSYERTISSLEAERGYFLILKNTLDMFPAVGSTFTLSKGHSRRQARIESYRCECMGPEKPHEHYFVRWAGLAKGDHLLVHRSLTNNGSFTIQIEE
ncbi:MAG: hypothetical protein HUU02_07355 [Bacteroidetes bacterium]|nr:hypothetical protein [Bacteroidota bacterium]